MNKSAALLKVDPLPPPETKHKLADKDFEVLRRLMKDTAGIHLADTKRDLVLSRLARRLRALKLSGFSEYCALLTSDNGADERRELICALTTNTTHFFREPHHFETLKKEILPPLFNRARRGEKVRIWSAGCSNGKEPYSIALTIAANYPDAADLDVRILASDIDDTVLRHARRGVYDDTQMRGVEPSQREAWFRRTPEGFEASNGLKQLITFNPLNLMSSWPMRSKFDVIFCRNVVIYFDLETQQRLWPRFAEALKPDGWMMIGHSERVTGPATSRFEPAGVTTFRLIK